MNFDLDVVKTEQKPFANSISFTYRFEKKTHQVGEANFLFLHKFFVDIKTNGLCNFLKKWQRSTAFLQFLSVSVFLNPYSSAILVSDLFEKQQLFDGFIVANYTNSKFLFVITEVCCITVDKSKLTITVWLN